MVAPRDCGGDGLVERAAGVQREDGFGQGSLGEGRSRVGSSGSQACGLCHNRLTIAAVAALSYVYHDFLDWEVEEVRGEGCWIAVGFWGGAGKDFVGCVGHTIDLFI